MKPGDGAKAYSKILKGFGLRHNHKNVIVGRRLQALLFVIDHQPCTVREIMRHVGLSSTNGAFCLIVGLRRMGLIRMEQMKGRTIVAACRVELMHDRTVLDRGQPTV